MGRFAVVLGVLALASSDAGAVEDRPSFHLVLSDGHAQLQGQSKHVAKEVIKIFREIGIDVKWSSDPSDPATPVNVAAVTVLPHSSRDWSINGAMAATRRVRPDEAGSIFLFYPDVARAMDFRPARTSSIRDGRPAGVSWVVGVARVIAHEIVHYFLPGRPHDEAGIFMEHQRGDLLLRPRLEVSSETKEALLAKHG